VAEEEIHPIREVFIAYLRGKLLRGRHAFKEHVKNCNACEIMLETLRPLVAAEKGSSEEKERTNNK